MAGWVGISSGQGPARSGRLLRLVRGLDDMTYLWRLRSKSRYGLSSVHLYRDSEWISMLLYRPLDCGLAYRLTLPGVAEEWSSKPQLLTEVGKWVQLR